MMTGRTRAATSDWRENTNGPINHGPIRYPLNINRFKNGFSPWRRVPLHPPVVWKGSNDIPGPAVGCIIAKFQIPPFHPARSHATFIKRETILRLRS